MKKIYLLVLTGLSIFGLISCSLNEETTTNETTTIETTTYSEEVVIEIKDEEYVLGFSEDEDKSLFDLIEESSIELDYYETDYGNMITRIGSVEEDSFHWISFTKNNDFATEGLDTISYEDGDVFSFSEDLKDWQQTFIAEYQGSDTFGLLFILNDEYFYVENQNLPGEWIESDLIVGLSYEITGSLDSTRLDEDNFYLAVDTIEENVIDDFTELYSSDEGDIVYIVFTVTELEQSYEFGSEVFAEDINGLSSKDISENLNPSYTTDYIFYTFPDEITLEVGKSYVGRFIYQTYEPNQNLQFGLTKENIQGEETDYFVEEIEE
ncbi:MAG: hypothetical protein K9L64_01955 [Candidatus Izimaplasma sp.]|nr:hypothetical protein [Candidatus Izimaplasma bacterium]